MTDLKKPAGAKQKGEHPNSGTLRASRGAAHPGTVMGTFWKGFKTAENGRYALFEFGGGQSMSKEAVLWKPYQSGGGILYSK